MEENIIKDFINILKGVFLSILFTIIFLFIFSIILTYTNISEDFISPVIIVTTVISIFIGSSISCLKVEKNGLLKGAMIGGIYLFSLYLISSIINKNFNFNIQSLIIILCGIICGMIGGIIGVNKK